MELKENTIKVAIRCLTYNHEHFIEDALNGFIMQQVDFPYAAIVVDDASTDKEPELLWNFINNQLASNNIKKEETEDYIKIVAPHKSNQNCIFVIILLKYNHYSIKKSKIPYIKEWQNSAQYIALCEGDDYWTDPLKLQKQVNELESHPECTICFGNVKVVSPENEYLNWDIPVNQSIKTGIIKLGDFTKEQFAKRQWTFQTSGYVYKTSIESGFYEIMRKEFKDFPYGDMPLVLYCLMQGNGYFISDEMSCYRWHVSGSWTKKNSDNINKQIETSKKLIKSLESFDKLTNFQYHQDVQIKILQQEFYINENVENVFSLLLPKYWELYGIHDLRHILYLIIDKYILSLFKK